MVYHETVFNIIIAHCANVVARAKPCALVLRPSFLAKRSKVVFSEASEYLSFEEFYENCIVINH